MKEKILVVDDEEDILELLGRNLAKEGYVVFTALSGEDALAQASREKPDLILLDLMLPGIDGLEVCRKLKSAETTSLIPVIIVSAKGEDSDIVAGLELGADDYVTKPFSPRVLIARIRTLLRRKRTKVAAEAKSLKIHDIEINAARHEVRVSGKALELTATELKILHHLALHPGWVFTRNQIISAIKGEDYPVTDRSIDVQIVGLRKKLGGAGKYIETIHGVGYRFKEPPER
ncbi:MAG: response regulator transcription factor [Myxococcota bacterium]